MSNAFGIRFGLAIALSACVLSACRADEGVLDDIFSCDPDAGDAQCGTDENGERMTCYVGSAQLGGKAFCTKTCDPARPADSGSVCTSSGALLERCDPGAEENPCQSPLNCYRTDVLFDDGLCMWVPICPYVPGTTELDDGQCTSSHPVCGGSLLRELTSLPISVNNLHCVTLPSCEGFPCNEQGGSWPEACPASFYSSDFGLPFTCSAHCDELRCPPNFTCAASASPDTPPICLPGVPGVRCTSQEDCLTGECFDTGAGFSVCTLLTECDSDDECSLLGSSPPFLCVEGVEGVRCATTLPFHGAICQSQSDCSDELLCGSEPCPPRICSHYSPYSFDPEAGDCRFECDAAGGCPDFGGLPHVCLGKDEMGREGGCFPGSFGIPCSSDSDCVANLVCGIVPTDERSRVDATAICTVVCNDDTDCIGDVNPWLGGGGYCVPSPEPAPGAVGYCRIGGQPMRLCERNEHCLSRECVLSEEGNGIKRCN
jgi:hypothetical protein